MRVYDGMEKKVGCVFFFFLEPLPRYVLVLVQYKHNTRWMRDVGANRVGGGEIAYVRKNILSAPGGGGGGDFFFFFLDWRVFSYVMSLRKYFATDFYLFECASLIYKSMSSF